MSAYLFVEGGGNGANEKYLDTECRRAFGKLIEAAGFGGRMPRIVACGGRDNAHDKFRKKILERAPDDYIGLLVDSEECPGDIAAPWAHLRARDKWSMPPGATEDNALLMVVCMETWIAADVPSLRAHYGAAFREKRLPSLVEIEKRSRAEILRSLQEATKECSAPYKKGRHSYAVLGKLNPEVLRSNLPSFDRFLTILDNVL